MSLLAFYKLALGLDLIKFHGEKNGQLFARSLAKLVSSWSDEVWTVLLEKTS